MAELGRATLVLETDDRLSKGLDSAKAKASKLNGALGGVLKTAGGFALAQVGMQGMSAGFDLLIGNAANFEQSLNAVQAVSGATTAEMALLRKEALGIGKDTSKTASEAVQAMGELVKAGMPVEEVINGVARAAVQFAEATGISVPEAATIMSDAMHTFSATGTTATQTAEVFSKAAAASSIGVRDLQLAMAAVGPVAASAGLSIEDFATSIALMGNNGLKSSDAGTSLKAFIAGLTPSSAKATKAMKALGFSAFDAQGNFKPMRQIVDELSKSMEGLTEEQKATTGEILFGSDGIRAMHVLTKEGAKGWDDLTEAQKKQLSIAEQSRIRMQGLNGQLEKFKGSIETLSIMAGSLLIPAMTAGALAITGLVDKLIAMDWSIVTEGFETVAAALEEIGALQPVLMALAGIVGAVLLQALLAVTVAAAGFVAGIVIAAAPIIALGLVLAGLYMGIKYVIDNWDELNARYPQIAAGVAMVKAAWSDLVIYWNEQLLPALTRIKDRFVEVITAVVGFVREHWPLIKEIVMGVVRTLYAELVLAFGLFKDVFRIVIDMINGDWDKAWKDLQALAVNAVTNTYDLLKEAFGTWSKLGELLGEIAKELIDLFWKGFKAAANLLAGYQGLMFKVGVDIIQGLWDGMKSLAGKVIGWAEDFIKSLPGKFTELLGISSPSKVMHEIGVNAMEGLNQGLEEGAGAALATAAKTATAISKALEEPLYKVTNPGGTKASAPAAGGGSGGSSGGGSSGGGGGGSLALGPAPTMPAITDEAEILRRHRILTNPYAQPYINSGLGAAYFTTGAKPGMQQQYDLYNSGGAAAAQSYGGAGGVINVTVNGSILTQQDVNAAFKEAALAGGWRGI